MTDQLQALRDQIAIIEQQEFTLTLPKLTNDIALHLGLEIRNIFQSSFNPEQDGIVISISLFSDQTLFAFSVGDPLKLGPDNWNWVRRKANTVKRFGRSSFLVGRTRLAKGKDLNGLGEDYAAHGGGFPLRVKGMDVAPVGVVVVSGLKQEDGHQLIVDALAKLIEQSSVKG
ncbi:hypothetical protein NDA13_003194 [Ustilago tritici]|nr:hypothetical protein NDA13_003194 [Ustilago tritici]